MLLLGAGCRSTFAVPEPAPPPDLASSIYFCPSTPPVSGAYACAPEAIPTCTFPAQELTCDCQATADGSYALYCPIQDGGTDL
ncbi:MAG TPA: hypothetical protein VIA18_02955 [Polyangia bacterium]|nr:hypothetical protein [Polyangia bacterium]